MGNIGIIGRARVGKDTAGKWLVDHRGYRRVAFADPLKEAALKLDPIVYADDYVSAEYEHEIRTYRLSKFVGRYGWERTKDEFPEVRRILQELGAAIRAIDEDFWLRAALAKVQKANEAGVPVVISDVRYPNEATALKRAGFHLVYVDRPSVPQMAHESENALTMQDADHVIPNSTDVPAFLSLVEAVANWITEHESRRHFARL